jgi:hypothetical protein
MAKALCETCAPVPGPSGGGGPDCFVSSSTGVGPFIAMTELLGVRRTAGC